MASNMAEIMIRVPQSRSVEDYHPPNNNKASLAVEVPHSVANGHDSNSGRATTQAFIASLWPSTPLVQKLVAEMISTFILVFAGCGAAMVDSISHGKVTPVGISIVFGLVVTVMIHAVGHVSGAHMNPAVTLAFAVSKHFPWTQVPLYIVAQCSGSITASFMLRWILHPAASEGATLPAGSDVQSLLLEIVITFILMFVVAAVATDTRACGELAGIAVGSAVALNALMAGPISGASMNPARSLGPAIASSTYRAIWVYIAGPVIGAVLGMLAYNCIRLADSTGPQCDKPAKNFRR